MENHYNYLDKYLADFLKKVYKHNKSLSDSTYLKNILSHISGFITSHGDKCYCYKDIWMKNGICFNHGCVLYFLTYMSPFNSESRCYDENGIWVNPGNWVIDNYDKFKHLLPN